MYISYSKDCRHNYLIIQDDRVISEDYRLKMLIKNEIEGLLECKERMINGEGLIYYDVTSKQTLSNCFERKKLVFKDICNIINALKQAAEGLSKYILDEDGLVLKPDFIYVDMDNLKYHFLYYPYYEKGEESLLFYLADFFTSRADNEDVKALEVAYQLADMAKRQHYGLFEIINWFEHEYGEEKKEKPVIVKEEEPVVNDTVLWEDPVTEYEEDERKPFFKWLFELIFGRKESKESDRECYDEMPSYDFAEIKKSMTEDTSYPKRVQETVPEKSPDTSEGTVFIPWIENNENKLYGTGKGNKYHIDLSRCPIIVGKLKENVDMILNDSSISRMHAKFIRDGNRYFMVDLNSTNGSFRNGMRLNPNESVQIEPGDEIGLGKLKFIYR